MKIVYSPTSKEKLSRLKSHLIYSFGPETASKVLKQITSSISSLKENVNMAPSVRNLLEIDCDYRVLYTQKNYVFYRYDEQTVYIVDIYHEREDFMWQLFGIRTTTEDTENYWNE